jgi:hypothetical protein
VFRYVTAEAHGFPPRPPAVRSVSA